MFPVHRAVRIISGFSNQTRLDRVCLNIAHVGFVICLISNPMLRNSLMPNRELHVKSLPNLERGPALDKSDGFLQCRGFSGSKDHVKVLGHRDITVDVVAPFVPIFELFCLKNFRSRGLEEHFAPFPRVRGNEIRLSGFRSVFRSSHVASGAKAPLLHAVSLRRA